MLGLHRVDNWYGSLRDWGKMVLTPWNTNSNPPPISAPENPKESPDSEQQVNEAETAKVPENHNIYHIPLFNEVDTDHKNVENSLIKPWEPTTLITENGRFYSTTIDGRKEEIKIQTVQEAQMSDNAGESVCDGYG